MKTLLLLAGRSRRFWPLEEKSLWPFLGRPLLAHQVERLQEGGLRDITFVDGHHNLEQVYNLFSDVPSIEQENLDLGMRGALLSALPHFKNEPVCIVSGNDVIEPEGFQTLIKTCEKAGADGAILVQRVKRYFPGGYIIASPNHQLPITNHQGRCVRVAGIVEKPGEGKEPSDLVNIVTHVHMRPEKLLEVLEDVSSERDDAYEVALTKLCKELNYIAVPYEGRWDAVKYPWHILDLTERFLGEIQKYANTQIRKCEVHPTAVVEGPVVLEEGVKVMAHAMVQGPSYIGKESIVGTNTLVRNSIVGEGCVIGFGSEIARSNLHSHVWTHTTYVGDSVIGRNVGFGAGTVIANFRLDEGEISSVINDPTTFTPSGVGESRGGAGEKVPTQRTKFGAVLGNDVRVGINVSFAPGVKVGKGSFISSAVYVARDVPEGKYVTVKQGVLDLRENRTAPPARRSEL